jgi:RNA polymerase sigma-70 factor (ECF subfamily)
MVKDVTANMPQIVSAAPSGTIDFDAAVRLFRPKLLRFALSSLRDQEAAESLTQDCFLKAYIARHRFRNECSIDTWLMQIAGNLLRDYARNKKLGFWRRSQQTGQPAAKLKDALADNRRTPEMLASLREQVALVWNAAERLPEKQKNVFLLRFLQDMDLAEIAAAMGMKLGTVKTHLYRAIQTVRNQLMGPM